LSFSFVWGWGFSSLLWLLMKIRVVNAGTSTVASSCASSDSTNSFSGLLRDIVFSSWLCLRLVTFRLWLVRLHTFAAFLGMLNALFFWFRRLITNFFSIQRLFRKNAIQSSHTPILFNLLKSFDFRLVHVNNDCAVDFVELVQIADSALD
jgi:hypothetical protein